jgi:hypothetical protein
MNVHHLNLLDVKQESNSTFRFDDVRQLLLHKCMIETDQKWTNDDNLKLRRLTSLDQVTIELIIVNFDM